VLSLGKEVEEGGGKVTLRSRRGGMRRGGGGTKGEVGRGREGEWKEGGERRRRGGGGRRKRRRGPRNFTPAK
jgi:hypothetical protein